MTPDDLVLVQCQGCGAIRDGSWLGKGHACWKNEDERGKRPLPVTADLWAVFAETCPTPGDDACTDMTACESCPSPLGLLTADEVAVGVAGQESAWAVGRYVDNSTQHEAPADLAEDRDFADHPTELPEGRLSVSILPDSSSPVTTPRREPGLEEWRARCLLALAVVNHRRTEVGLSPEDTADIYEALSGRPGEAA